MDAPVNGVPSDLFPFVLRFLRENRFSEAAAAFVKKTNLFYINRVFLWEPYNFP
uniref:LisH domain-containing protein n=1 Tax=Eptatretus burgeri TaxID=7764 RepID=A0A8C4R091_EPTBU